MRDLPKILKATAPASHPPSGAPGVVALSAKVRVITPVLGGGVAPFEPDEVDVVRVPSIRGSLRWWWRALQPALSIDALRLAERRVWGGVGDTPDTCAASRVRVAVRVLQRGTVQPAGSHKQRQGGGLRALPDWSAGASYGYALFPLQRTGDERRAWTSHADMPTRSQRSALEFELVVRCEDLAEDERDLVRRTVAAWLTLGGYGARSRRGFGAMAATGVDAAAVLRDLATLGAVAPAERPTLGGAIVLQGPPTKTAGEAHRALLAALQEFRQGTSFGRNPGEHKTFGRSRWPEADSLRAIRRRHDPRHRPRIDVARVSAPRAAFGLPIGVSFIDREDAAANGVLTSEHGDRWASPLLLRPVQIGDAFVPVALAIQGHRPTHARLDEHRLPVLCDGPRLDGAFDVVRDALRASGGDALDAFANWLVRRGYRAERATP